MVTRAFIWLACLLSALCSASLKAEAQTTLMAALPELGIEEHCQSLGIEDQTARFFHVALLPPSQTGDTQLDCVRVQIGGHFRWIDEGGAALHPSVRSAYLAWDREIIAPRIYLGDWPDGAPSLYLLNGTNVILEGVLFNYCKAIETAIEAGNPHDFVVELGLEDYPDLCNGYPLDGYLLFNVRLVSTAPGPAQRVRGEINRGVLGNLARIGVDQPHYDGIETATRRWAEELGRGEAYYLTNHTPSIDRESRIFLRDRPFNISDLYGDSEALRTASGVALSSQPIAVFRNGEGDPTDSAWGPAVFGCICLQDECSEVWPLDTIDLPWMPEAYICTGPFRFNRENDNWERHH